MDDHGAMVRLALAGDSAAFTALYRANVATVAHIVCDTVSDPEAAADLVQETFVRALEKLGTLREPESFRYWLMSIARNAVRDRHRSNGRFRIESLDEEGALDPADNGPSIEELSELRELADLVSGCVAGLSLRDATAISMFAHLELTPTEIAPTLGVSPGAAKVILFRARRRLRDALTLELMVRRRAPGCPEFDELFSRDHVAAGKHIRGCIECTRLVEAEVHLYHSGFECRPHGTGNSSAERNAPLQPKVGEPKSFESRTTAPDRLPGGMCTALAIS
jgi:RNA polymerase sigma factor (sigma-70 family)